MDAWLIALIIIGSVLLVLGVAFIFFFFCFAILPGRRNDEMERYRFRQFAHRGLHGEGVVENSLSAFKKAAEQGFGIELDIRLCRDGELVVFHDEDLFRVCGIEGRVVDYTADELASFKLGRTDEGIPTFRQVLELVDGAVPLLIEIKNDIGEGNVAEKFVQVIEGYKGEYIVESFNPLALRTVRKARPDILLGILSCQYSKEEKYKGKLLFRLLENLRFNFLFRPDFIAYERSGRANRPLRFLRKTFGTPLYAWTVRSAEEEREAISDGFDSVIFEGYIPE